MNESFDEKLLLSARWTCNCGSASRKWGAPMSKKILLKNLMKAAEWLNTKQRDHDQAGNIVVGCFFILRQAGQRDVTAWINRRPERRRVLGNVRETYLTRQGNKVLRDLLALTTSSVEACAWVDDWLPYALPTPISPRGPISEEHLAKLQHGKKRQRDRAKEVRMQRAEKENYAVIENKEFLDEKVARKGDLVL